MPPRDFNLMSGNDRPHPGPLPRGEGERIVALHPLVRRSCSLRLSVHFGEASNNQAALALTSDSRAFLPLLGERAGVRAVVLSN